MKKLLIGLLVLGSISNSSFSATYLVKGVKSSVFGREIKGDSIGKAARILRKTLRECGHEVIKDSRKSFYLPHQAYDYIISVSRNWNSLGNGRYSSDYIVKLNEWTVDPRYNRMTYDDLVSLEDEEFTNLVGFKVIDYSTGYDVKTLTRRVIDCRN